MNTILSLPKLVAIVIGCLWAYLQPTIPFLLLAFLWMVIDIYSAYRLNCRVKKKYGDKLADGKLKSNNAFKIVPDAAQVFACIILAHLTEIYCFPHLAPLYLPNYVCAGYCAVQVLSVAENASTCNNAPWARILQKYVANKIARHLDCTEEELAEILQKEKED